MIKLIKFSFFLLLLIVGLYFFGDFRINDTNVRDFLQKNISMQNFEMLKQTFNNLTNAASKTTFSASGTQSSSSNSTADASPMDRLSNKDREKMIKLLKKNLESIQTTQTSQK